MAKVKSSALPHYELLYIISNKYSEDEIKPIKEKVIKLITDNEGKITYQEDWGKKRFSYSIEHFNHGYYELLEFDMPGEKLINISKALRLSKEILRNQIVKKHIKTTAEIATEKEIAEKIAKKKTDAEKDASSSKAEIEDINLDDKLDKILETDNLL